MGKVTDFSCLASEKEYLSNEPAYRKRELLLAGGHVNGQEPHTQKTIKMLNIYIVSAPTAKVTDKGFSDSLLSKASVPLIKP